MNQYVGTKLINGEPMSRQAYNDFRGWQLPADEDGFDEGFLVEYIDGGKANTKEYNGYVSWSPKDVFKNAYHKSGEMTFGDALVMLKAGKQVARKGWNGKDQFVYLIKGNDLSKGLKYGYGEYEGEPAIVSSLAMKTTANQIQIGWLASQTDMLAEDWCVID